MRREGKLYQDKSRSHFIALEIALMESEVSHQKLKPDESKVDNFNFNEEF